MMSSCHVITIHAADPVRYKMESVSRLEVADAVLMMVVLCYLLFSSMLSRTLSFQCTLQNEFKPGFRADGDFVIGGIFPLHYNQEMPDLNCTYKPGPVKCNG